jgi:hypothetical protein
MIHRNASRQSCAIFALGLVALALPQCATKDRKLDQLMQAEDGGDGGKDATGKGGSNRGGAAQGGAAQGGAAQGGAAQGGTTTDASSLGGQGGTANTTASSNGGTSSTTDSTTDSTSVGGGAGSSAQGGQATAGGNSGLGGAVTTGGTTSQGGSISTGGTTSVGGTTSKGGTTSTGGTINAGGTTTATTTAALPRVVIASATVNHGTTTSLTTASFKFTSNPTGATKYECKVDGGTTYANCTTGLALSGLIAGPHSFTVRAYNAANASGPELTQTWTVAARETTIHAIREGNIPVDSLVTVSTGVRLSGMFNAAGSDIVFVRETELNYSGTIDNEADLLGEPALNSAILTRPATKLAITRTPGSSVTVTGVFKKPQNNAELINCSYLWGSAGTAYKIPYIRNTNVLSEALEGMPLELGGEIDPTRPTCGSTLSCYQPTSNTCICGCSGQYPVGWMQLQGTVTSRDWGTWTGFWVQNGASYYLWVIDSFASGDDVCM